MATIHSQNMCADLAQALQEFWEDYTGVRPARVRVVADEQSVAVCMEQVLTPAEREMASTQDGREMLRELQERVLEQAKPYLQQLIEEATQQVGILAEVHLDVTKGNVLGFFRPA